MTFSSIRQTWYSRLISLCLVVTFVTTMVVTPKASYAGVMGLPQPGTMVNLSPAYVPLMVTGLTIHPENPLLMDFIVSTGNSGMNAAQVKKESDRLIKYFLACLTIPENNQWVNLSPYEKDRIIPEDLGQTVLGQDMLAQDYILKQLTASLIYPEKNLGKNFWDKVYAKAAQMYGTTQIPVNTFNKVWILPEYAKVYEHKNTVLVIKSHLKVMLDEDYLALQKHAVILSEAKDLNRINALRDSSATPQNDVNHLGSQIVRQIILPAIEKEVNQGQNFSQLRQIYNSMILAVWFKTNLKQALLNQVYTDKSKTNGVNADDPAIKEKIYQQYLQAYKKGVFNYIKEEPADTSLRGGEGDAAISKGTTIARKYFSGGLRTITPAMLSTATESQAMNAIRVEEQEGDIFVARGATQEANSNPASNPTAAMTAAPFRDGDIEGFRLFSKEKAGQNVDAYPAMRQAAQEYAKKQGAGWEAYENDQSIGIQRKKDTQYSAAMITLEFVRQNIYPRLAELATKAGVTPGTYMESYIQIGRAEETNTSRYSELETLFSQNRIDIHNFPLLNQILENVRQIERSESEIPTASSAVNPQEVEEGFNSFQPKVDLASLALRPDSLANFIHIKGEPNIEENLSIKRRTINFDDLFTLVSTYSKQDGTTRHEFFGYGITPIIMREAQAGDDTEKDWKEILVQLEDGISPDGIPYRDGIMQGNAYNERMTPDAVEKQIISYEANGASRGELRFYELSVIKRYFLNRGKNIDIQRVQRINSNGKITFGMALIKENGQNTIVVETGFLDLIEKKGNPFHMLERAFVYLLNQGTHEQNRIAEYEYAKFLDPNISKNIRVDVEQVYHNLVTNNLTAQPIGSAEQYSVTREWQRKVKESLWEIGVNLMNGDMQLQRVRWSEEDPEFTGNETDTGDVTIGVYASALNPLHFGQFEPVLRAMAQLKIAQVGVVNHGFDYRKQGSGLNPTFDERDEMAQDWINQFGGLLTLSKVLNRSQADGETKFRKIMELNANRKGRTTVAYVGLGGDHMHIYAPSKEKDAQGYRLPKMDGNRPQPDTVTKIIIDMRAEMADFLARNRIDPLLSVNFRELFESLPMPIEVAKMKEFIASGLVRPSGHINLFATSSTNIRLHYSGDPSKDISFLPKQVSNYITTHGRYRGWIIGLPYAIQRIAKSETPDPKDIQLVKNWLGDERTQQKNPVAATMAQEFSFTETQLRNTFNFTQGSLEDAERATGVSFRKDLIQITEADAQKAINLANNAMTTAASPAMTAIIASNIHKNFAAEIISGIRDKYRPLITDAVLSNANLMVAEYGGFSYRFNPGHYDPNRDQVPNDQPPSLDIGKPGEFDNALLAKSPEGGIDLNSRNLNLQSEGQRVNITFNAAMIAQFKRGDFSGVRIKILDVEPVNLMPLLGLKEDEMPGQLAKA